MDITKAEVESIYDTTFTEDEFRQITVELSSMSKQTLNDDTRYFNSLTEYVQYKRDDEMSYENNLIQLLIWLAINEPNNLQRAEDILVDSEDIKLGKGRYILVMQ